MAPNFLSQESLLQLENFVQIAFLNLAHFVQTVKSNILNISLQFQHFFLKSLFCWPNCSDFCCCVFVCLPVLI